MKETGSCKFNDIFKDNEKPSLFIIWQIIFITSTGYQEKVKVKSINNNKIDKMTCGHNTKLKQEKMPREKTVGGL
jgi:hypothetical protein